MLEGEFGSEDAPAGSPLDPMVQAANHDPSKTWDPMVDYAGMSRNVRAFMSLFHCTKPVITKVHGFCVAGGTGPGPVQRPSGDRRRRQDRLPAGPGLGFSDHFALGFRARGATGQAACSSPVTALPAGEAAEAGLAIESHPREKLDEAVDALAARIAMVPLNQLQMMKLLVNQSLYARGLHQTQLIGTVFDGITRPPGGYAFQQGRPAGFKQAVRERDEPFGDFGLKPD